MYRFAHSMNGFQIYFFGFASTTLRSRLRLGAINRNLTEKCSARIFPKSPSATSLNSDVQRNFLFYQQGQKKQKNSRRDYSNKAVAQNFFFKKLRRTGIKTPVLGKNLRFFPAFLALRGDLLRFAPQTSLNSDVVRNFLHLLEQYTNNKIIS